MTIKPPKSDKLAEAGLLGALLIDENIVEEFFVNWQLEWFYHYREIAEAVFELALEGSPIDLVTTKTKLEANWTLEKIWGVSELAELTEAWISFNWQSYSTTLQTCYKQREIAKIASNLLARADDDEGYEDVVETTMTKLSSVLLEGSSKATTTEDNIQLLESYIKDNQSRDLIGWSWWNEWLDHYTLWVRRGKTYRIGAPSWVGKTNLIYGTIVSLLEQGVKVLFVSLENDVPTTLSKLLSAVQETNNRNIEKGTVAPDYDWLRKHKDNFILTDQLFDVDEIKREVLKVKPDVVILDYIGLVNIKGVDDEKVFTPYSKKIKEFIQKNPHLAWIDLSNLNQGEGEEQIRKTKGKFNWSASLRSNTDFWLWLFEHEPFQRYKWLAEGEAKTKLENYSAITFYVGKNRLWPDPVWKTFWINFDKGINYSPISDEVLKKWEL